MVQKIQYSDNLKEGTDKLNQSIDQSNDAILQSKNADQKSTQALNNSVSTQTQLDNIVVEGDSSVEAAQARVDSKGESFPTLKARIDNFEVSATAQLQQTEQELNAQLAETFDYTTKNVAYVSDGTKENKPFVSFIADDAPKNDLTRLLPIMQEKNIPVGIGVITDRVGKTVTATDGTQVEYMTWEDIKHMELQGAEIMSHSHTHAQLTDLSEEEVAYELSTSFRILHEEGYLVDGFIYPYNARNSVTDAIIKRYAKYSFVGGTSGNRDNFPKLNNDAIRRVNLGAVGDEPHPDFPQNTLSLEYYKARVDWAMENSGWLVFVLHTALSGQLSNTQQQYLRETIDYIRSKGIDIVSPREGFIKKGNILQIGDKRIYNDGSDNFTAVTLTGIDAKSADMPMNEFELNKITITPTTLTKAQAVGMPHYPRVSAGVMTTYNLAQGTMGLKYRKYECAVVYSVGNAVVNETYIQNWDNGWQPWRLMESTEPSLVYKSRKNVAASSVLDVGDRANFITINAINPEGLPLEKITGGVEGTEVILFVTINAMTVKHNGSYAANTIILREGVDLTLRNRKTLRLIRVGVFWVQV